MNKKDLDLIVLNIEFLLISVVQGVALSALATGAIGPLSLMQWEYWPGIISGFLLILIFWSQSIMHSLSFVDWPIDLPHGFLYFLASFFEVVAFSQLMAPGKWYGFISLFFLVVWVLYTVDLSLIRQHERPMKKDQNREKLYAHLLARQTGERNGLLPFGIGYNVLCCVLIWVFPAVFLGGKWHLVLGIGQMLILGYALYKSSLSYRTRTALITACMER